MSSTQKLILYKSIAYFLKREVEYGGYLPEVTESLDVAKQCMESAFGFSTDHPTTDVPDLISLFKADMQTSKCQPEISEESKAMAETLKNQGNHCMKANQFQEAIDCYTKAIERSPNNAVYFSNRAAAYSCLDQQQKAIEDCQCALKIDPKYSKAYSRMGIAYSSIGDYAKAVEAYRKCLELDPSNETCQQNLAFATERLRNPANTMPSNTPSGGTGGLDFGALFNNPMMQNIACQLMRDPNTQNVMADLFRNTLDPNQTCPSGNAANSNATTTNGSADSQPSAGSGTGGSSSSPGMDQFLRFGQQLAQQLRSSNPQLVDQLRQTFHNMPSDSPDSQT